MRGKTDALNFHYGALSKIIKQHEELSTIYTQHIKAHTAVKMSDRFINVSSSTKQTACACNRTLAFLIKYIKQK